VKITKITTKLQQTWRQTTGPKTIIQSLKLNTQHRRPSLPAVQGFHVKNFVNKSLVYS